MPSRAVPSGVAGRVPDRGDEDAAAAYDRDGVGLTGTVYLLATAVAVLMAPHAARLVSSIPSVLSATTPFVGAAAVSFLGPGLSRTLGGIRKTRRTTGGARPVDRSGSACLPLSLTYLATTSTPGRFGVFAAIVAEIRIVALIAGYRVASGEWTVVGRLHPRSAIGSPPPTQPGEPTAPADGPAESSTLFPGTVEPSDMPSARVFAATTVALGVAALAHAAATWPLAATVAFFGVGALVAFVAEAVVIGLGWLDHHVGPKLAGVPVYILFGWTGTVYVAYRIGLLVTDGWAAVVAAGVVATTYDLLTDHRGVADGRWSYTDDLPGPRYRGVPWWNFAGWFAISCLAAAAAFAFR